MFFFRQREMSCECFNLDKLTTTDNFLLNCSGSHAGSTKIRGAHKKLERGSL